MQIISHRVNTVAALNATPRHYWVEVDIRVCENRLVLQHDAFAQGEALSDWLSEYAHQGIVLNVKADGLEETLYEAMEQAGVGDYFFLDSQPATTYRLPAYLRKNIAVRVSDLEKPTADAFLLHRGGWAWLDVFEDPEILIRRIDDIPSDMRLCLAAPDIMPTPPLSNQDLMKMLGFRLSRISAVVTKSPELWDQGAEFTAG